MANRCQKRAMRYIEEADKRQDVNFVTVSTKWIKEMQKLSDLKPNLAEIDMDRDSGDEEGPADSTQPR